MKIQDYCINEKCTLIKMRYEYILIHEDKYVISWINKNDDVDIQSMPKRYLLSMIVIPIFFLFFFFMIRETLLKHDYFFLFLWVLIALIISIAYIRQLFYATSTTVIQKEKIIDVSKDKWLNTIVVKYKDNNNKAKQRRIMLPANESERALTFQLLKEYNIYSSK